MIRAAYLVLLADERIAAWSERMAHYQEHRIHPQLPAKRVLGFYPMSKRRTGDDNWYVLSFEERKALMAGSNWCG